MKYGLALIGLLLLSACAGTGVSDSAICAIERPTFTEDELMRLSDETLSAVDLYFERMSAACGAAS